jgi:signal transduction histidine kinase
MRRTKASIRTRLTLLYGGMAFLAGIALVTASYLLVRHTLTVGLRDINTAMRLDVESLPPQKRDYWLAQLADQRALQEAALGRLLTYSLIATALVALLSVGAGWLMAGRVVRPLHQITHTARGVAERNLGERIRLDGPNDELKELADTFDAMLERLDRAFESQRRFAANASHELRTPLTLSRTLIQVALTKPEASADLRKLGTQLLDINTQQRDLTEALLVLARTEAARIDRQPVDLTHAVQRVAVELAGEASAANVDVAVPDGPAPAEGDPVLLELMIRNLVLNAIRYNHPGGWVRVEAGNSHDRAWLTITNTSPRSMNASDVETMFEPFRRLGVERTTNSTGSGLGLSIVRAITNAHGGHVVARPLPTRGLTIRLDLPHHVTRPAEPFDGASR